MLNTPYSVAKSNKLCYNTNKLFDFERVRQMNEKNKCCCFIGHRKIEKTPALEEKLYKEIEKLIESGIHTFMFGSRSDFDSLCYEIVTDLKKKPKGDPKGDGPVLERDIKRIYVRAEYPYINQDYYDYLLKSYEETYYPEKILNAGRAVYAERNQFMIDMCSVCVFYYSDTVNYKGTSGTEIAYKYAVKKHKRIINAAV